MSTANLPPAGTPADDEGFRRRAGALLRSAADDLEHTSRSAAADLGLTDADYAAHLAPEQGFSWDLAQRAATVWPLNERDLVPVRNDCPRGVRVLRATESASSARVFQRGGIDYYEYRDTAMSRLAPFRPAWIRMLSVVTDDDPHNADVHWNSGHVLYQFTYFVGPVNYYYRWNGRDHVLRMNTGDSIWGLPFSPHTFTARNAEEPAYVLALTYGGELMGDAQHELAALGPDTARGFALDTDSAAAAQGRLLRSYLDASALLLEHAAELCGIPAGRLAGVADGGTTLTPDEVTALAAALRLSPRDLLPVVPDAVDGVSFCPAATSRSWYHPSAGHRDYRVRELAGDRLHPHTRALEIHPQRADSDSAPRTGTEQALAALWCETLGLDEVGVHENFFTIGGDSLWALRTAARCRRAGLHLDPRVLYEAPTVARLAARLGTGPAGPPPTTGAPPAPARPEEPTALADTVPLLPNQHRFFGWTFGEIGHDDEPLLFAVDHCLDRTALARCLIRLADRHPALTSRFVELAGERRVRPGDSAAAVPLEWHDHTGLDEAAADRAFTDAARRLHHRLDLREGPVCRAAYFRRDGGDRLLLLLHHLVCDGVTLHTLAEELSTLYRETAAGLDDTLGPPPPSALGYARELQDLADALPRETPQLDAWLRLPWDRVRPFPTTAEGPDGAAPGQDPGSLAGPHLRTLRTSLDPRTARTVRTVAQSSPYTTEDLLIAAVASGVAEFSGASAACLDVVRHGRLSPLTASDLSRTVGRLSTITPFVLDTAADGTPPGAPSAAGALPDLRALSAQIGRLHAIEHDWGVLRHLHRDPAVTGRLAALPKPEVYLDFRGAGLHDLPVGPPFSLVTGDTGVPRTPTHPQPYPLEIRIDVADQRLDLHWKFSLRRNAEDDVRRLARRCTELIVRLAESATGT
ncbi:condensation domain-containing protein [Streptomyces noursei]|uniref:condensation domain-containing protein n=1 Tax=Streptomyces noursei TaxID=1971 RepID=UPI0023B785F2|nr:condensation domain-containing protein [Streptomyces noursei]